MTIEEFLEKYKFQHVEPFHPTPDRRLSKHVIMLAISDSEIGSAEEFKHIMRHRIKYLKNGVELYSNKMLLDLREIEDLEVDTITDGK